MGSTMTPGKKCVSGVPSPVVSVGGNPGNSALVLALGHSRESLVPQSSIPYWQKQFSVWDELRCLVPLQISNFKCK